LPQLGQGDLSFMRTVARASSPCLRLSEKDHGLEARAMHEPYCSNSAIPGRSACAAGEFFVEMGVLSAQCQ
jgi:hypothetical protein